MMTMTETKNVWEGELLQVHGGVRREDTVREKR